MNKRKFSSSEPKHTLYEVAFYQQEVGGACGIELVVAENRNQALFIASQQFLATGIPAADIAKYAVLVHPF